MDLDSVCNSKIGDDSDNDPNDPDWESSENVNNSTRLVLLPFAPIVPAVLTTEFSANYAATKECHCVTQVERVLKERLDRSGPAAAGTSTDGSRLELIARLLTVNPEQNFDHLCYNHAQMLASHCGLQTGSIKGEELRSRLLVLWNNRSDLGALKTGTETFKWFRSID